MRSAADNIKFNEFCKLLDDIKQAKQADKQIKLKGFIERYRNSSKELSKTCIDTDVSFYPVLRLLLPNLERERGAYGLKKFGLTKTILKILCLPNQGEDAQFLNNSTDDFASAAHTVLSKHFPTKSSGLSIIDVNRHLDVIALKNSENKKREQEEEISKLFKLTSPNEQKWIIRMILKEMSLGLGHNKILTIYHPDAIELFDSNNNLAQTCEILHDPNVRYNEIEICLFCPFRPMLSERCGAKEFLKAVDEVKSFNVEIKFDGERFQMHMKDGEFKYFSRNGFDFTKNYGDKYDNGLFTPSLRNAFEKNVRSIILDGEMMGWDTQAKKFGSKGMNFDVKKLSSTSKHKPCFCVFDMLLLNGVILTNKPLRERLEMLVSILSEIEGVIVLSRIKKAILKQDIINALNESMDNNDEGIVFKNPDSLYKPNNRKGGWWKMKLEYFSDVMSDLDVIIMGGYYGKGDKINGFIVGVAVPPKKGPNPTEFLSLAKISSGLSNDELDSLHRKIGSSWIKFTDSGYVKHGLYFGKEKPDVWISPEKSSILDVRASELIKLYGPNPGFKAKYTLRFPRIQKLRLDKPYYDCVTTNELENLTTTSLSVEKLFKRHLELSDVEFECKKVKKRRSRFARNIIEDVSVNSDILDGYEFCVLTGYEDWKSDAVEKNIREHGGTVVKTETDNTFCILLGSPHPIVPYFKKSVDIVKLSWLRNVLNEQEFFMYEPQDMIHTKDDTKYKFMSLFDKYGDSFTENATKKSLQNVLENVLKNEDYINPLPSEIESFHEEIQFKNKFNIFQSRAYFDKYKVINDEESTKIFTAPLEECMFKFWGGHISNYLNKDVDLVIVNNDFKDGIAAANLKLDEYKVVVRGNDFGRIANVYDVAYQCGNFTSGGLSEEATEAMPPLIILYNDIFL